MSPSRGFEPAPGERYVALCTALESFGNALGLRRVCRSSKGSDARKGASAELGHISKILELADIALDAQCVINSSRAFAVLVGVVSGVSGMSLWPFLGSGALLIAAVAGPLLSIVAWDAIREYPNIVARKAALELARDAPEATNLVIMSLRHEPSLPNAIQFASSTRSKFSMELRRCTWSVVMGVNASFEDALHEMGDRWSGHLGELKAALHSMVTSSCESTEDGKRRALDRASGTMAVGARRRIEEYALSLSFPSMILFGVGILLPLIAGSFLPMLSWSIWNPDSLAPEASGAQSHSDLDTILVMNVIFPAIAAFVAVGAVSRHPMRGRIGLRSTDEKGPWGPALAGVAVIASATLSLLFLEGMQRSVVLLLGILVPISAWLIVSGRAGSHEPVPAEDDADVEDILFRTGARMVEGENFESALWNTVRNVRPSRFDFLQGLARTYGPRPHLESNAGPPSGANSAWASGESALLVVRQAAAKDEIAAGMLAMDLAVYIKELRDIERTLMNRLRPTISMMRTTAYALGPVVLGVTFAIYLSLAAMVPPGASAIDATTFFLVMGVFLAEVGAIVSYFVWGIERRGDLARLKNSTGTCILCSTIIYACTAMLAS